MVTKTNIELQNFFVFNSTLGSKEGEEGKKILYYYPISDNVDKQVKNVGLVEGIIQFVDTFKPSKQVSSLHTTQTRQLYFSPETNFWIVLTLKLPTVTKNKEGTSNCEFLEDDLQDNVYEAILQQAYKTYRLFWGCFNARMKNDGIGNLKMKLEIFYNAYIKSIKLANCDLLNIFSGIQYLPLDKQTFLKVQCFVNLLESKYGQILYTSFLYNDYLIWSGIEPSDMQIVYQYLISTVLPANMENELQGGSMPRNSSSPFAALHHGRFITGPTNLKLAKTVGKIPKVYLYGNNSETTYYFVIYRALSATVCMFLNDDLELNLGFFKDLDSFINPKLTSLASDIAEYCSKQVVTPSASIPETAPRFIYFNKLNLAYKSTVHLDNKQSGNVVCTKESLRLMADMNSKNSLLGHSGETIVKTMNDNWVICKTSNAREFFIVIQQKNVNLIDISEEVKKLCDTELKGIFFHPI